jgi:hypothetical protein
MECLGSLAGIPSHKVGKHAVGPAEPHLQRIFAPAAAMLADHCLDIVLLQEYADSS